MTQTNLADELGVSYQAVSNWERGNSMPDISKIPELCRILGISFEELIGGRSSATAVVEKLMQDGGADVSLEEIAEVGELVKPDEIGEKVNQSIASGEAIPFSTMISLAPFLPDETLDRLADRMTDVDADGLVSLAPFLPDETLDRLADRMTDVDADGLVSLAPFLSSKTIGKIVARLIKEERTELLPRLAPFMGGDMF